MSPVRPEPLAPTSRSVVVGTAGHIDHGKSALVHALTGTDPDRLKEEKARGITIDLGFAHLWADDVMLAFVDVPGHERFVKNMLAGAGGIDLVALVVAANESVKPQTREHFQICRLLGVQAGVIVLTKSDLADRDMLDVTRLDVADLVAGSFLQEAPIVAVSSRTGAGLDDLRTTLRQLAAMLPVRNARGPLRLPIDRVFSMRGFGTVATGTLVSGEIREEQDAVVLPDQLRVRIRGLQVHGRRESAVSAGRRLAVNVGGVELAELRRGQTLTRSGELEVTRRLDAAIDLLADSPGLRHGGRVRFHHGTSELLGRVAIAGDRVGEGGCVEVAAGGSAHVRIRLEGAAVLTRGDRFILRAYSPPTTIGGGVVLDPHPPRTAIRTPAGRARLERLDIGAAHATADAAIEVFLEERGAGGLPVSALISRAGLSADAAADAAARLVDVGQAVRVGDLLVARRTITELGDQLVDALTRHHAAQPLSGGLPREEARERVCGRAPHDVFDLVVEELASRRLIVARERLTLAGHAVQLSPEESRTREAIERCYREAGLAPPDRPSIAPTLGLAPAVAERVMGLLVREKVLVRIDTLIFHTAALARLRDEVRSLSGSVEEVSVDVPAFKARYGISRKYAIPLLEYLDRERITRRVGERRVVR